MDRKKDVSLRVRAISDLRRTLDLLDSLPLPEGMEIREQEFDVGEETGLDEITVQLAEQERTLQEKDHQIVKCTQQIKELQSALTMSDSQDKIILEQAGQLKKYENQLTEMGMVRAQLVDKEEMIQQYVEQINSLEENNKQLQSKMRGHEGEDEGENAEDEAQPESDHEISHDALEAIQSDPNLTSAHKKTMVMLYSQYTTPRKALKQQMRDESSTQAQHEEAAEADDE